MTRVVLALGGNAIAPAGTAGTAAEQTAAIRTAMEQVAHQCICVQYLLELAKQLDLDPRSCISSFFTK